ncbi:hypothetical protein LZ30DRAFT_576476 [Colletotrichum cereale]|nr:hypothetical protein LZ30DRAFT_576476 [Colletotrichum cereale]
MKSEPEEKEVYVSLRSVFWGPESRVRKRKTIQSRLRICQQPHTNNPDAAALIKKYQLNPVVAVCRRLLKAGVFESTQKASARFPGIEHTDFQTTTLENGDTENENIETKTEVVDPTSRSIASICSNTMAETQSRGRWIGFFVSAIAFTFPSHADTNEETDHRQSPEIDRIAGNSPNEKPLPAAAINADAQEVTSTAAPSLQLRAVSLPSMLFRAQINSACFPYQAQHALLVRAQEILENSCFKYAVHSMPRVLRSRRWDAPECGELNIWVRIFTYEAGVRFKGEVIPHPHRTWSSFFKSIIDLRHKAVHRQQLTGRNIESYLRDAQSFARLLRDDEGAETLARFREETRERLKTLEFCKKDMLRRFQTKLDEINRRRAELDTLERQAKQVLLQRDKTIQAKLGSDLKESVVNAEAAQAKEERNDTEDHEERKTPVGLIAFLWYLIMSCTHLYRGWGEKTSIETVGNLSFELR